MELTSFFDEITPWERRVLAAHAWEPVYDLLQAGFAGQAWAVTHV